MPLKAYRHQLEVNSIAPLLGSQASANLLGTDRRMRRAGRIVNISSVEGRFEAPFMGADVSSKHGLEGMSESLGRELLLYGMEVMPIGPGSVATPIWDKAEPDDLGQYGHTDFAAVINRFRKHFMAEGREKF